MTIDKNLLGNKRKALNTLAQAIDVNIEAASSVTVADADGLYTGENVEDCLAEIAGVGRVAETVVDNASDIDDVEDGIVLGTFGTIVTADVGSTGSVRVTSRIVGTAGNGVSLTLVTDAALAGTVAVVGTDVTVEVAAGGTSTAAEIVGWVNGHYLAKEIMFIEEVDAGAMIVDDVGVTIGGADNVLYSYDTGSTVLAEANFTATGKTKSLFAGQQLNADAIDVLNDRDVHLDNMESGIYKHPLMAVVTYDYDVDPALGNGESIDLHRGRTIIPDNAIIMNVAYDVVTQTAGGDVVLATKTGTAALTGTISAAASGLALGIPDYATSGEWVKTTAVEGLTLTEQGTGAMSAGKIHFYIQYVVSE